MNSIKRNHIKKNLVVILCCCFIGAIGIAQQKLKISGIIIEKGGHPIPYATVIAKKNSSKKTITGSTTNEKGEFHFSMNQTDGFFLEVSFLGYAKKTIENLKATEGLIEIGTIILEQSERMLEEVVIEAEKSTTEFKLDKRVFNVGKDLSSTGASALEVLNNVPSVNVSIEGQITLRGNSGVQVLINNKPSVLASEQGGGLGTLTAEMIEKVEVITNPSAKYDAEGSSGIINIVLKKEEERGLNGSISLNTGTPHNHSIGLSLNRRSEKFNLFTQLGAGYRELPRNNRQSNTNRLEATTVYSEGKEYRNEEFYNLILGTDYHINQNSVLTLSGSYALELEKQPSDTDFRFENALGQIESSWNRTEKTDAVNPKYQYELQYKNNFKGAEDHSLLISALGNFFGKDQSSEFTDRTLSGTDNNSKQQTETDFKEAKHTFNLDYTKPVSEKLSVETGTQYVLQEVSNAYAVFNLVGTDFIPDPNLTNTFDYEQNVLGVYGTASYEGEKWGVKLGLRLENTDVKTRLETTGERNTKNFSDWFPTLHTSYKLTEGFSVQAGYSKRIYRPRLWDLNPFFNIRNSYSIRTGNPNLLPEFTDSYEVSGIFTLEKASLNLSVFKQHTTDVIERISTFENNVTTYKPENIGTNNTLGIEFNAKYSPVKMLSLQGDFNYSFFTRNGSYEGTSFDFSANRWETKWTAKFKFPNDFDMEATGRYDSEFRTVQGRRSDILSADVGLRKKFMKGKAVINLSIRDIFASRIYENVTDQPAFYTYQRSYRGRFITLGLSYGFGKGEAMEYSGSRRR